MKVTKNIHGFWYIPEPNAGLEYMMDQQFKRTAPGKLEWEDNEANVVSYGTATPVPPKVQSFGIYKTVVGMAEMATSFLRSMLSGTAADEVIEARRKSCFEPCPALDKDRLYEVNGEKRRGDFCGACGCGYGERAELKIKLTYAYLKCPLARPGFSNEAKQ